MFHILTNIQDGAAVGLQQSIDNRNGSMRVGLRSLTVTVGWYNVEAGEMLSWRRSGSLEEGSFEFPPGFYRVSRMMNLMRSKAREYAIFRVSSFTGLITLEVLDGWELHFTDGLLSLLNIDDGLRGTWLDSGTYEGDRAGNFTGTKTLSVHLHQLSTTANFVDGAPSTLLALVGLDNYSYGDTKTIRFDSPEFKHLIKDSISELEVIICDDAGKIIDNHQRRISLGLEFVKQ